MLHSLLLPLFFPIFYYFLIYSLFFILISISLFPFIFISLFPLSILLASSLPHSLLFSFSKEHTTTQLISLSLFIPDFCKVEYGSCSSTFIPSFLLRFLSQSLSFSDFCRGGGLIREEYEEEELRVVLGDWVNRIE